MKRDLELKAAREMVNGNHFRVGTLNDGVRSRVEFDPDGNAVGDGLAFELLNELSHNLNFTYEIVLPPSYFNARDKTTMESLLIGMLIYHKIDLAVAFIPYTMDRKRLISFSLEMDTINCLTVQDDRFKLSYESALDTLQPFYAHVCSLTMYKFRRAYILEGYINTQQYLDNIPTLQYQLKHPEDLIGIASAMQKCLFLLSLIVYVACLIFLTRLRSKIINDDEEPFTLSSSLSYTYRVLTKQEVQRSPKPSVTRILLITWSLFVFLVSSYYGAHLSRGYTLTAVARKESIKQELSLVEASGVSVDYRDVSRCYSKMSIDKFLKRPSGFAFPLNSSLNSLFDAELKKMYYYGYLQNRYNNYLSFVSKVCPTVVSSDMHQLRPLDLAAIFYSWLTGVIVGTGIFIMEILLEKLTKEYALLLNETPTNTVQDIRLEMPKPSPVSSRFSRISRVRPINAEECNFN